jgi:hypothetical protein
MTILEAIFIPCLVIALSTSEFALNLDSWETLTNFFNKSLVNRFIKLWITTDIWIFLG